MQLAETWQENENSQQTVLGLVTKDKIESEQITFLQMKDSYEAAIDEVKKITKGELKVEGVSSSQLDRALRLTAWRMDLHEQVTRTLNHVKAELETADITQPQEPLKAQHGSLTEAKRRIREAKDLSQELLEHHVSNFEEGIIVNWFMRNRFWGNFWGGGFFRGNIFGKFFEGNYF